MSRISLSKKHNKPESDVRHMVGELVESLARRYDAKAVWEGDSSVKIDHSRLSGRLDILPGEVRVDVKLGMLAGAFKGKIESELRKALDEKLS
ncbi:putative polyhydroxyalkanoate system protein [Litorivivens lipolytica]|uniref:Putative polyhydroxyalkanoate system protein n=1 Tax=Litorivivens lipolytica TaxID=1524264 RepID=A0A7W4Z4H9_9GAMM|nr:polyhydroxyalkanoic acid system family protein [Litorivivens lipolytica]MBB3046519.1 putative polyhydroxyalkanoate system protein [Litorivivens lipolytica]